jgi:hypothetical protein
MYQMKSLTIIQKHTIVIWKFLSSSDQQQQQQNRGIGGLGEYIRNLTTHFLVFCSIIYKRKNSLILAKNIYCLPCLQHMS